MGTEKTTGQVDPKTVAEKSDMSGLPRFENTWTFGNTLTLVAMAIGGFMVYSDMASQVRVLNQIVVEYRGNVTELRTAVAQNDARIRALELGVSRIEEKLVSINAAIQRVETALNQEGKR